MNLKIYSIIVKVEADGRRYVRVLKTSLKNGNQSDLLPKLFSFNFSHRSPSFRPRRSCPTSRGSSTSRGPFRATSTRRSRWQKLLKSSAGNTFPLCTKNPITALRWVADPQSRLQRQKQPIATDLMSVLSKKIINSVYNLDETTFECLRNLLITN